MIGYYGYTMTVTYLSVASAITGMYLALYGEVKYAFICLILSGICDMLDGPIARASKRRTDSEKSYGIQLDSLADIVNFGVFPAVLGYSLGLDKPYHIAVMSAYVLAAIIRLAYFNVTEMELQQKHIKRTYYMGLPVTNVAGLIPIAYAVCLFFDIGNFLTVYTVMLVVFAALFLLKIKIPKVRTRNMAILTAVLAGPVLYVILTS